MNKMRFCNTFLFVIVFYDGSLNINLDEYKFTRYKAQRSKKQVNLCAANIEWLVCQSNLVDLEVKEKKNNNF